MHESAVSLSVDEVDLVLVAFEVARGGAGRLLSLGRLLVEVGDDRALIHLSETVHGARGEK